MGILYMGNHPVDHIQYSSLFSLVLPTSQRSIPCGTWSHQRLQSLLSLVQAGLQKFGNTVNNMQKLTGKRFSLIPCLLMLPCIPSTSACCGDTCCQHFVFFCFCTFAQNNFYYLLNKVGLGRVEKVNFYHPTAAVIQNLQRFVKSLKFYSIHGQSFHVTLMVVIVHIHYQQVNCKSAGLELRSRRFDP